jgi:hypothetical protein
MWSFDLETDYDAVFSDVLHEVPSQQSVGSSLQPACLVFEYLFRREDFLGPDILGPEIPHCAGHDKPPGLTRRDEPEGDRQMCGGQENLGLVPRKDPDRQTTADVAVGFMQVEAATAGEEMKPRSARRRLDERHVDFPAKGAEHGLVVQIVFGQNKNVSVLLDDKPGDQVAAIATVHIPEEAR